MFINLFYTLYFLRKVIFFFYFNLHNNKSSVLFINFFRPNNEIIELCAKKCFQPYVINFWFPGTLTNVKHLLFILELMQINLNIFEKYSYYLRGLFYLKMLPSCIFASNIIVNGLPLKEALNMNIPIVGLIDTFDKIDNIYLPIPTNTKSVYSIYFYNSLISKIVLYIRYKQILLFKRNKYLTLFGFLENKEKYYNNVTLLFFQSNKNLRKNLYNLYKIKVVIINF